MDSGFGDIWVQSSNLPQQVRTILLHAKSIFTFFSPRHIANNSLFIDIATILWTLTIEPARDDKGEHIMPNIEGNDEAGVML